MKDENKIRTRAIFFREEELDEVVKRTREMVGLHNKSQIAEMRAAVNKGYFN